MTRGQPTRPALLLSWLEPSDFQIQQPLEITLCSYLPAPGSLHGYLPSPTVAEAETVTPGIPPAAGGRGI